MSSRAFSERLQNFDVDRQPTVGDSRRRRCQDADTPPAARAREGRAADTVRTLYRRYQHPVRGPRPVRAAARPGITCHSAPWGAHRRRSARIFLTGLRPLSASTSSVTVSRVARGQSGVPLYFLDSVSLCDVLHIRVALTKPRSQRSRLWVEGNHAVSGGG